MKKHFWTGFVIVLPLMLTLMIVLYLIKFLTSPFLVMIENLIGWISTKEGWLYLLHSPNVVKWISKILILIFLFYFIVFIGYLARHFIPVSMLSFANDMILKIPLVKGIYKSIHDVINNLIGQNSPTFTKAVRVPFTCLSSNGIGFLASESLPITGDDAKKDLCTVYLPCVPNPIMGVVLLYPKDQITPLDLTNEDTAKFLFSCGIICNNSKKKPDPAV